MVVSSPMSPCKNRRSMVYTPHLGDILCVVKAQISIFPPGKYQRPARFEGGVSFSRPPPYGLRAFSQSWIVFDLDFELLVNV